MMADTNTPIRGWITDEELNDLLSLPEREYMIDLSHRLLRDLGGFEFSATDKYALADILPKITACMDIQDAPRFNLNKHQCRRCLEEKCACENWDDDDPDLPSNKLKRKPNGQNSDIH